MGRERVRAGKSSFSAVLDGLWTRAPAASSTIRAAVLLVSARPGDSSSPRAPQFDQVEEGPVYRKSLRNKRARLHAQNGATAGRVPAEPLKRTKVPEKHDVGDPRP